VKWVTKAAIAVARELVLMAGVGWLAAAASRAPAHPYTLPPRTTITGQWACATTASETLPIMALLILPRPLVPTTNPAPNSSARPTVSAAGDPVLA
jgi:hypothetical protein